MHSMIINLCENSVNIVQPIATTNLTTTKNLLLLFAVRCKRYIYTVYIYDE